MKAQRFLCALLMSMLIACWPGNAWATVTQTVTAGFNEGQEQHVTVNDNVNVSNQINAVFVEAHAPDEAEDKTASAKVNGNVTLTNEGDMSVVYVEGRNGDASANITGDISGTASGGAIGIETWGHSYNGSGEASVTAGGSVSAESLSSNAAGIKSDYAGVNVTEDVTAKGKYAYGVESNNDKNLTIGGDIKSEGEITSAGMYAYSDKKTEIDVKGGVSSTGNYAKGLQIESSSGYDLSVPGGDLSVTVGNGVQAVETGTNPEQRHGAVGISFNNGGRKLAANINGDVESKAANGGAIGIKTEHDNGETGSPFGDGSSEILVHGNVISDGIGVTLDTFGENTDVNVLVENEILAKTVGVSIGRTWFAEEDSDTEPELTVWKIGLNDNGHAVEWGDFGFNDPYDDEYKAKAIADFEKHIMYIAKVEQPSKGGTLKAVDADGKALPTSYGFPVAHEGEKVILKANLQSGWKIKAAYNGDGANKQKLSKDENGNYYIIVPKGGGVYLSADLEKEPVIATYTVTFVDGQGKTLKTQKVESGKAATAPAAPKRSGYTFTGWDRDFSKVTRNMTVTAKWKKAETKISGTLLAKLTSKGQSSLVLTWNKVKGAEGYDIFFIRCGKQSPKKVETIKGNKTFKWTKESLKTKKAYKAVVKAYVMKNGKKTYVRTSPIVHAYTAGGTKNYTNAESVTVKKTSVLIKLGKTYKIKASVTKLQKDKKLMPAGHAPKLRYVSSNKKVATVSKFGKIRTKSKGSCKVYVIAVNGAKKAIAVDVK